MVNTPTSVHTLLMELTTTSTNIYVSTGESKTSSTPVTNGLTGQTIRIDSLRMTSARG